jgi:hypothetical protein
MKAVRCGICRRRIRNDNDSLFFVIRPKGLSEEVIRDAALKASEHEENSPTPEGPERWAYQMISALSGVKDKDEQVVAGRAFHSLGFRVIQIHKACKPDEGIMSNEYVTEEWLKYK